jgi:predicted enzyme related to lactoylglutathione lyase
MPTRLVHLVVDSADPRPVGQFWAQALGWPITDEDDDEVAVAPAGYEYPSTWALPVVFEPVPEPKTGKNRVHFDLGSTSIEHQATQVNRLIRLGAKPVDIGQGQVPWAVMADPEGNEFCVLEPRDSYRDTGPVAAVVIDCQDPVSLARFWQQAAGWAPLEISAEFAAFRSPDGRGPHLELLKADGVKTVKNRVHLDLRPFPGDDHAAEIRRLLAAGAAVADTGQPDVPWTVLTDPEGNEFCVLAPL